MSNQKVLHLARPALCSRLTHFYRLPALTNVRTGQYPPPFGDGNLHLNPDYSRNEAGSCCFTDPTHPFRNARRLTHTQVISDNGGLLQHTLRQVGPADITWHKLLMIKTSFEVVSGDADNKKPGVRAESGFQGLDKP